MNERIYQGKLLPEPKHLDTAGTLCLCKGEAWDIITDEPLAGEIADDILTHGEYAQVQCFCSQTAEVTGLPVWTFVGRMTARYEVYYEETDGQYDGQVEVWEIATAQGTHDLIGLLQSSVGRYCKIVVNYFTDVSHPSFQG